METPLFDPPGGNVSNEDIHQLIYPGSTTKIFVNMLLGYCTPADSSSSPTVPRCNDNVMTNYTSDNTATVDAEIKDMVRRGIDGMVMDWYGGGSPVNNTTLKFQSEIKNLGLPAGSRPTTPVTAPRFSSRARRVPAGRRLPGFWYSIRLTAVPTTR